MYCCTLYEDLPYLNCSGIPPGGWSSVGLNVEDSNETSITCTSTHLTSFAVLVDVSGASQVYLFS